MSIRRWIYYRYLRTIASSYNKIRRMNFKDSESDEIQKSILKIVLRLINKSDTNFLTKESSYLFTNGDISVLISFDHHSPTITLISGSDIQKVNIGEEYIRAILSSYEREVSRRIRKSFLDREKIILSKLSEINKNLE